MLVIIPHNLKPALSENLTKIFRDARNLKWRMTNGKVKFSNPELTIPRTPKGVLLKYPPKGGYFFGKIYLKS